MGRFLSKEDTAFLKAVAILFMLIHHFWGFPEWLAEENAGKIYLWIGMDAGYVFGKFAKICVAIFAFLTGYAIAENKDNYLKWPDRKKKLFRFLTKYWINYGVILMIGLWAAEPMPSFLTIVACGFGLACGTKEYVNCNFAWYVFFYIEIILISPQIVKGINRISLKTIRAPRLLETVRSSRYLSVTGISGFLRTVGSCGIICLFFKIMGREISWVNEFFSYLPAVVCGYCTAEYRMFEQIAKQWDKVCCKFQNPVVTEKFWLLIFLGGGVIGKIVCLPLFRNTLDFIFAPIIIFCLVRIKRNWAGWMPKEILRRIKGMINLLAKESVNIWFLHAVFFTPEKSLQWIACYPEHGLLVIGWVLLLLLPLSVLISWIHGRVF